jgi:hypothetical protein
MLSCGGQAKLYLYLYHCHCHKQIFPAVVGTDPHSMQTFIIVFSGAFAKLRKATIGFVVSVRPSLSLRLSVWSNSFPTGRIFMKFEYFSKICQENSIFTEIWHEWRVLYMTTDIHFRSHLAQFLEWEIFQRKFVGEIKTHILCSVTFSRKSCLFWDNVETYCRTRLATDDNMAHAHCVLDT